MEGEQALDAKATEHTGGRTFWNTAWQVVGRLVGFVGRGVFEHSKHGPDIDVSS